MSASKGSSRATAALCRAGNGGREMSGSSWSIPISAGGIWDQSEREQMVPRDTIAGLLTQFLALLEKKKNQQCVLVFCNSARGRTLAGGTERCPAQGKCCCYPPSPQGTSELSPALPSTSVWQTQQLGGHQ